MEQSSPFQMNLTRYRVCSELSAYGMFIRCGETRSVWFNPQSLECDAVFELTGMILGLAIYNGIILDVPLAGAMYSKLRGRKPTLQDLWDIEPTVARSLKDLLDYDGSVEEDLCLDFQVVLIFSYLCSTWSYNTSDLIPFLPVFFRYSLGCLTTLELFSKFARSGKSKTLAP